MKKLTALLLLSSMLPAYAQSVQQSGSITPGHPASWVTTGVIKDGGSATNGSLTGLGVTNNGTQSICANSAPITGSAQQICLGATTAGGGVISVQNYGGASAQGISFNINGHAAGFVLAVAPFTSGSVACFANSSGNITNCGTQPLQGLTVGMTAIANGATTRILYDNAGILGEYTLTGTGTVVAMQTAPTILGHPTIEGVTSTGATGTGNLVFGTSPSISGLTVTGSFAATGLVTNADLANPATTVNGQTCTLGSTCTVTAAAASIVVGSTTIGSGTSTRILYDNAGVLGEYLVTGSGTTAVLSISPTFTTGLTSPLVNLSGTSNQIIFQSGGVTGTLSWTPASTNKTIVLPNGSTDFTGTGGTGQVLRQSSTGAAITVATLACSDLSNGATGCSTATGTSGATIPLLNGANTWSGVQTFTNSDIALLGSSTGKTTFTSANSGVSNFTLMFPAITSTVSTTIASGAKTLNTTAVGSASCSTVQTDTATGTLTTDAIGASFNGDPTAITGYVPLTSGMLVIIPYPTADTVNFKVCNNTATSITPGAVTINWRVVR